MCGIVAWINSRKNVESVPLAGAISELRHRGPDQQRLYLWRDDFERNLPSSAAAELVQEKFSVGMAHSRLSIIDLNDHANQPMTSPDGRYVLIFNGEIYNYRELAVELRQHGVQLKTSSDTEVLLNALMLWGDEAIPRLNGMWAFAFFDRRICEMMISRDRFGKKPLFYHHSDNEFVMASEFKAIFAILGETHRRFNNQFLRKFLDDNWPTFEDYSTAYEGVYAVEPGSVMTLKVPNLDLKSSPIATVATTLNQQRNIDSIPQTVASAVELRLRADVPTAILLSGGVDSSIVAGFARLADEQQNSIRWYTGETNFGKDMEYSLDVAKTLGVELTTINVADELDPIELLSEMNAQYEIPIRPNGNSVAMYQMYKAMAKDGIRVVLDGTGGDEIFGGYFKSYAKNVVADLIQNFRWLAAFKFIRDCETHGHFDAAELRRHAKRCFARKISWRKSHDSQFGTLFDRQLQDIRQGALPRWLYMNDQNSMAHSIEARSPMLDYRLLGFLHRPVAEKFDNGFNKKLLRQALPKNISDEVRWRRDKQGFRYNPVFSFQKRKEDVFSWIQNSVWLSSNVSVARAELDLLPWPRLLAMCSIAMVERSNLERRTVRRKSA